MKEILYGRNPVREALRARRRKFYQLFLSQNFLKDPASQEFKSLAETCGCRLRVVDKTWFEQQLPQVLSQGCALEVSPYPYVEEDRWVPWSELPSSLVLVLDQIQDPQNLGALLRSAECIGVSGVVFPKDHSCELTPTVAKASAGAMEHLEVSAVVNLKRALERLKALGFWVVGTDLEEAEPALGFGWPERTALVLGSEGQGMRRLTREACDYRIKLPIYGQVQSLNVASAATACLYLWRRQYP